MTPEEEEAAFLEAIQKDPEERSLHHAYASHLTDQGRHGEALLWQVIGVPNRAVSDIHYEPHKEELHIAQVLTDFGLHTNRRYDPINGMQTEASDPNRVLLVHRGTKYASYWTTPEKAMEVVKGAKAIGLPLCRRGVSADGHHPDYISDRGTYHQIVDAYDSQNMAGAGDEEPVRHATYRAPKGGAVVRGTFYVGGRLIPDLEGDFANPPQQQQAVKYPQIPAKSSAHSSSSLLQRIRRGLAERRV